MNKIKTLLCFCLFGAGTLASATLLVYDGFSGYTVDQTVVGQGPVATGFTGNWSNTGGALAATVDFQPRSGGLTYANFAPNAGGSLEAFRSSGSHSGAAKKVSRSFDYADPGTDDFFIALLIQNNSTSADSNTRIKLQALAAADSNRDAFFDINHATNELTFSAGGGSGLVSTQALTSGANLVVVRSVYDFTTNTAGNPNAAFYDVVNLWVNPTLNANATPTLADLGAADATGFGIMRSFNGSGAALSYTLIDYQHELDSGSVTMDEFLITTSLDDIVAIPEPGSLALVGIALGSLLLFRRGK